jgi:hypothetical protein
MPLFSKIDNEVKAELKKILGSEPEFYVYVWNSPIPFWLYILLAGGVVGILFQKSTMLGYSKGTFAFLPTSPWRTSIFYPEKAKKLARSEIVKVQKWGFGWVNYFTLTLKDGSKMRLIANTLYKGLEKQAEGFEALKRLLKQ